MFELIVRRAARVRLLLVTTCAFAAFTTPAFASGFRVPVDNGARVAGCGFDSRSCASADYHTGVDWVGDPPVRATADGVVEAVVPNDNVNDHGLGRSVILRHETTAGTVFSQYSHMSSFGPGLAKGACIAAGQQVGTIGGSGYGQENYWPTHLHFEIKEGAVIHNPRNGGPYWGYTPGPAENYGYRDPEGFYPDKVATTQECGVVFDQPRVFSSNVLTVTRGDRVGAIVQAHYRGLTPLECGYIDLGTRNDAPAAFRADKPGFFPKSQWRSPNRVAAYKCIGQLQPGAMGRWAPEFRVPRKTKPGVYLAGVFHPVYDAPQGGAHSTLNIPIRLRVVRSRPPRGFRMRRCLIHANRRSRPGARRRARVRCLKRCVRKAGKRKRPRARRHARKSCRRAFRHAGGRSRR